ncbi:MAG: nucleoside hydrolase, partial [Aldersonia sp.]|nr:nucleoside hydrolase [Aldersonia sp.]
MAASALAFIAALLCPAAEASAQRIKIILDTDIGDDIDDGWALGLAMQSPALDLQGVTIGHGNTPARAKVACKLLHAGGRNDVPVAVGRKTSDEPEYQFSWAEDFTAKAPVSQPAADFIIETVRKQPGEITLVAVGPLENVADALRKDPGIAKLFKRVVLMSGSIGASAWHAEPIPEWNVVASTPDAQVVYAAGLPITT